MQITFLVGPPDKDEFYALFETTGWNREYRATADELSQALTGSQQAICAYDCKLLVGFGRILTDGLLHALICEMIVHPAYHCQGIGTQILKRLLQWCSDNHIRDVQLFCARGKRDFYEKNGFIGRPDDAPGMQYLGREAVVRGTVPGGQTFADPN